MLRCAEKFVWALAITVIVGAAGSGVTSCVSQQARISAFDAALAQARASAPLSVAPPDTSDWSAWRARMFESPRRILSDPPQAVLRIPAIRLEAEIFQDTDARSLDLGVGHIKGTARPGQAGNIGLAGHRDGYFRPLKDVRHGQTIEIVTRAGRWYYRVSSTRVVEPSDIKVLAPSLTPALTLVTCYPFYFLGHAPQRFVVHARLVHQTPTSTHTTKDAI